MSNVQQPEMRRSGKDPLVQDSAALIAEQQRGNRARGGPEQHGKVPPDQRSPYGPGDHDHDHGKDHDKDHDKDKDE